MAIGTQFINAPYGKGTVQVLLATGTTTIPIVTQETYVATPVVSTGNCIIALSIDANVRAGARLYLQSTGTATETITFDGVTIIAPQITQVAAKTWTQCFWYTGTSFVPMGARTQIN